jgi:mannose-6-phosphate isomerase-like protein (cupin superfamily)
MEKVNIKETLKLFDDYWSPKIVGQVNDSYVKMVKFRGEFVWHQHEVEDEMFLVVKGRLLIKFRDRDIWLEEGEFLIIPSGVEHQPVAEEEVHVLLFEPKSTLNTGNVRNERTVTDLEHLVADG